MPLLDVFWTMLWFFLWILWFFLLFRVLLDIFRSRDLGGWGKAGWVAFVIILPFLGVLVYLIARGRKMTDHDVAEAQAQPTSWPGWLTCVTTASSARPSSSGESRRSCRRRSDGTVVGPGRCAGE